MGVRASPNINRIPFALMQWYPELSGIRGDRVASCRGTWSLVGATVGLYGQPLRTAPGQYDWTEDLAFRFRQHEGANGSGKLR